MIFGYITTKSGLQIKYPKALPLIDIKKIKRNPHNVKEHPKQQIHDIAELIKMVGFKDPVVLDDKNLMFAGHGRLDAAVLLEMPKVPWYPLADLNESEKKMFLLYDNKVNESNWIKDKVKLIFDNVKPIHFKRFEMEFSGYQYGKEETAPIPETPKKPKAKLGDIYQLGNHRIVCGDSTNSDHQKKLLQGIEIECTITDPPYNINYKEIQVQKRTILNDNMKHSKFIEFLQKSLSPQPKTMYVFCNWKSYSLFEEALESLNRSPKACIVWDKEIRAQNLDKYFKQHEFILYVGPFGNQKTIAGDIWREQRKYSKYHPTAKPVKLIQRMLLDSTNKGDVIYDPFLGSGSTIIACEQTDRICYGIELSPGLIDVEIQRWEKFTKRKAKKLN